MTRYNYRYAGLTVASELELPEWEIYAVAEAALQPQIWVRLHPPFLDSPPAAWQQPQISPTCVAFLIPEVAYYQVSKGCDVTIIPAPGAGSNELRLYLLGTVWGALCYQRGLLPLHAGVIGAAEGAIAFAGPTGAGKSTATAWLVDQGHPLLGDDLCTCELPMAGAPQVWPAAPRIKLWKNALETFGWTGVQLARDHYRYDKFHLLWPGEVPVESLPLRAIVVLGWGEPAMTRLNGLDAVTQLVGAISYCPSLLEPMGRLATQWQRCAELARRVPIWQFSRPHDWSAFDAAMHMVVAHLKLIPR